MRLFLVCIFLASFLFAHKLNIFVSQDNEKVVVSSYFASGSFCKECKVEVFDIKKNLLESGQTDENGEFIITKLEKIISVRVEALGGHAASKEFEVNKLEHNKKIEKSNSLFQSLIAIVLIAFIFLGLKRFKK